MILFKGICHYKQISIVNCAGCDMEITGKWYCDSCADKEYRKLVNAGFSKERILKIIDKMYFIHNFEDIRNFALRKML